MFAELRWTVNGGNGAEICDDVRASDEQSKSRRHTRPNMAMQKPFVLDTFATCLHRHVASIDNQVRLLPGAGRKQHSTCKTRGTAKCPSNQACENSQQSPSL